MEKNVALVIVVIVLLLLVNVDGSDLPECRPEISCPDVSCVKVPLTMFTTTSNVLCIDKGSPSSIPFTQLYLIEGCNGTYTNSSKNTNGICVVDDKERSDLYLTVNELSTGLHELHCLNENDDGDTRFVTVTSIAFQVDVEFDVVVEINGEAMQVLSDDSEVTVEEDDTVVIIARAVGGVTGSDINGSVQCTSNKRVNCSRGFLCSMLPGRYLRYSYSPVTLNETGLRITFALGSISRSITLNVMERPPSSNDTTVSPSSTPTSTTKTPEDDGSTLSTVLIVVIVIAVTIVAIIAIVIVVSVRCKRDQSSSTSTDFDSPVKVVDNAYQQYPGQAKAMLYLCPNCMDKDRITSGLQNNGIEIVDLPDESSLTLMDELYSYLDDGGALVSCDCPRDTQSNLRRVITNLSSEAAETRRWNVFIISRVDQDTDKLINRNNVIEISLHNVMKR
ncbi:uncharacterized protein [Dysidea avara]|uniref:uncharacterized protein isoform X2 n=1 Tax=Dysidea avara TaxID=196820 RepID=UPI003327136B